MITLTPDHGAWLLRYCERHNLQPDRAFAGHCAAIAEASGTTDQDDLMLVRQRASEEVRKAQYARSQAVLAGQHEPSRAEPSRAEHRRIA